MEPKFKPGDQVMLQSSSPFMTVEWTTNGDVTCIWFINNEPRKEVFVEALLKTREEATYATVAHRRSIKSDYEVDR